MHGGDEEEIVREAGGHPGAEDSFSRRYGLSAVPEASENSRKVRNEMDPWCLAVQGFLAAQARGGDRGQVSVNQAGRGLEEVETAG